mmetsp:Transcript_17640/g.44028  ORF Transcript_17640/g.44028 Transcript_17640/m.44028 type:complete len:457 (-) Transcript_17640:615-1985(-)
MMRFLPCVAGALLTATAVEARAEKDSSHSLQAVLDPSGSLLDGPPSSSSSAAASAAQAAGDRGKKTMRRHTKNHVQQEQQEPRSPSAAALVRKSSTSSSTRSGQENSPKPKTGTSSALQTLVRRMDAKKKSKAGALVRSSATQKKSSSRLRTGKASMKNSVADHCETMALINAGTSPQVACKDACIAKEQACYNLQSTDAAYSSGSTTTSGMASLCSDACLDARTAHEAACENLATAYYTTAQEWSEDCANMPPPANATVGQYCSWNAVADGTGCQDACTAFFATCYEADEETLVDDVDQDGSQSVKEAYCTDGCYSAMDSYVAACPHGMDGQTKDSGYAKYRCDSINPLATATAAPTTTDAASAEEQADGASSGLIIGGVVAALLLLGGVGAAFATGAIGGGGEAAKGEADEEAKADGRRGGEGDEDAEGTDDDDVGFKPPKPESPRSNALTREG